MIRTREVKRYKSSRKVMECGENWSERAVVQGFEGVQLCMARHSPEETY